MPSSALSTHTEALALFNRSVRGADAVTHLLQQADAQCHLISPASACGELSEGMVVSFSTYFVNIDRETYRATPGDDDDVGRRGGQREALPDDALALGKSAIDRIGRALAVSWNPRESKRLDSGRHPYYCHFKAVGSYRHFDGEIVTLGDDKEIDLREGSAYIQQLRQRAARKNKTADLQIAQERVQILSLAATKARLRAMRQVGIWPWYRRSELLIPFVVARVMFTGATSDPALRREFAIMQAKASLSGMRSLYGDDAPAPPALPAADLHDPPALDVHGASIFCDYCGTESNVYESSAPLGPIRSCDGEKCVELSRADALRETKATAAVPSRTTFSIPYGDEKGVALAKASDAALQFIANRIRQNLADGKTAPRYRAGDQALLDAMREEIAARMGEPVDDANIPH